MFENQHTEDLELMYAVFVRDEATLVPIVEAFESYIAERGVKIVTDERLK